MAKTYLRTGRIAWTMTAQQKAWYAQVDSHPSGSTFSATLDSPTETFLVGNGVISVPSSAVVASSGDTVGNVPVDNGDGTYSWGAASGGSGGSLIFALPGITQFPSLAVGDVALAQKMFVDFSGFSDAEVRTFAAKYALGHYSLAAGAAELAAHPFGYFTTGAGADQVVYSWVQCFDQGAPQVVAPWISSGQGVDNTVDWQVIISERVDTPNPASDAWFIAFSCTGSVTPTITGPPTTPTANLLRDVTCTSFVINQAT